MRRAVLILLSCLSWLSACAPTAPAVVMRGSGAMLAPGMRSVRELAPMRAREPLAAWSPDLLAPTLEERAPSAPSADARQPAALVAPPATPMADGAAIASAWIFFQVYKETYSRVDGNRCGFAPSCSRFGFEAVRGHALPGVALAFGRLLRPHHDPEHEHYLAHVSGYLSDPVTNQTFFWGEGAPDDFARHEDPAHAWWLHVRLAERLAKGAR